MIHSGRSLLLFCLVALPACQPGVQSLTGEPGSLPAANAGTAHAASPPPASSLQPVAAPAVPGRLTGGLPSLWSLCDAALQAVEAGDTGTLQALRITETEYRELVFPESPQAQPGNSIPVDFLWFHLDLRSRSGIVEAVDGFRGMDLELAEVVVTQGVDEFASYRIHKKVEVRVKYPDGRVQQIKLFGSVVEMDGAFKILAFPT